MNKLPDKIYLQLDGDGGDKYIEDSATWNTKRVFDSDVVYFFEKAKTQDYITKLEKELIFLRTLREAALQNTMMKIMEE
ncbi:MAG: hypothetical protein BA863_10430 [Desulfovibrio sp. S3730MH75]|nr:MAG: hypothetical protein BA863_10430 [Desulfovibrio sp. S3730MH75]